MKAQQGGSKVEKGGAANPEGSRAEGEVPGKRGEEAGTARKRTEERRSAERTDKLLPQELLEVLTAFKDGDFSARLPHGLLGVDGRIADLFNEVISMNEWLTEELVSLNKLVGKEGRISKRIAMGRARGQWATQAESVNALVSDLVHPISETSRVIGAVAQGDLSQKMTLDIEGRPLAGEFLRTAKTVNLMVDQLGSFAAEVTRVAREVGTEGKLGGQARVKGVAGTWKDLTDSVNSMAGNLTSQVRNVATVTTAVANGDLSKKITVDVRGEMLELKDTINTMVDQLNSFASEVTRVAREVGTEGKLGGQADVKGVAGTWKDLTDNVNSMAGNLTGQVRNIATVTTAVANGDLTKKITVDAQGEILELKNTINTMVDQLSSFADEVTRVAKEVGTEGELGGQAAVKGVAGTWKDLTDNVNLMATNLTVQLRDVSKVATAIASGDLTQKVTVDVKGEILQIKNVINTMVDQLSSFAAEVTRVAKEVGTEGELGGQADVKGVAGTWKDLTDSVNSMAGNLTSQVRNIAAVTTAVANGDLSKKITVTVKGEMLELKNTINTMVDQLNSFASEVTRVAREVGTDGKLGGQADVKGVAGTWEDLTDSVNSMAGNLTSQVRNIAAVTTAVATGDLSKKITVDAQGEILELKSTINTMVDQLSSFADEVTRVAREVGTEGKLGGQADVKGVAGTWKDLTDSVNSMAGNLTGQVRNIAAVTTAVANGDLSKKITVDVKGEILELKNTINTMVDQLRSFAAEVTRVAREVGTEGKLGGQASVPGAAGTWKDLTDNVNSMAGNLTGQVRNIATVTTAVANGDLSKKITVDVRGEIAELKDTINTMVDQLNSFASEVTRVAREVGTEGKLGGQANVPGVAGTWKDLTDNVNSMAGNLTAQVRGIATVVTAVARGDLQRKLAVDAKGEIAELADTINGMIDTLAIFADQVTTMAREVGVEGKLGGQASVPGASGIWKNLTENVNQLAANLTTQVRAIADVATAVTRGDLTRSIKVQAQGEVAALKDNINEMIRNLKDTTRKNAEQDWLKTNLAKFSRMLQGQKDLLAVAKLILSELAPVVDAQHGAFFILDRSDPEQPLLRLLASYACKARGKQFSSFELGEGLIGQCAVEKQKIQLNELPPDYIRVNSGLGEAAPRSIVVLPILVENRVKAVMELASFDRLTPMDHVFLDQLCESIGIVLNTIEANTRTEDLLTQSQSLASELQNRQEELQKTNAELQEKAKLLASQNVEVERKNKEVEQARQALEEKAKQLSLTSKYKSEFLANMSHELRTPLNSLLILSDQLSRNPDGNLTDRQVEFAQTILSAGNDLLNLINDILDLSKIESGTAVIDVTSINFRDLGDSVERTFCHVAEDKDLVFEVCLDPSLPGHMETDGKRLQQIMKNLLANAFKFTERGSVRLTMEPATGGWSEASPALDKAEQVIAISVSDTGIGIPAEKQRIIFEAFQQADGSTNRNYGGTGLGLAISRELAQLLGGEIQLRSAPGEGSTFTLFLPLRHEADEAPASPPRPPRLETASSNALGAPAPAPSQVDPGVGDPVTSGLDDTRRIVAGDQVLLIVESDPQFARLLADTAHEGGWKVVWRSQGASALKAAHHFQPAGICLEPKLGDADGWSVLSALKGDLATRHIPVWVISGDDALEDTRRMGAVGTLRKSVAGRDTMKVVMQSLARWAGEPAPSIVLVGPGPDNGGHGKAEELAKLLPDTASLHVLPGLDELTPVLADRRPDLLIVRQSSPPPPDGLSLRALGEADLPPDVPVLLDLRGELASEEKAIVQRLRETLALRVARTREELIDELSFLLHRPLKSLPEDQREAVEQLHDPATVLAGKGVLIVDDDIRNIFAMTSLLERFDMHVRSSETGDEAIEIVESEGGIDIVLMDIMMPKLDGYETTRAIRQKPAFRDLPIIALTAKAMVGDREKCLEAGASDYVAKPVRGDYLVEMLAKWLK